MVMTMLHAYQLLLFCITVVRGDVHLDITDMPKLAKVDLAGNAGVVYADMRVEKVYPRQDIMNILGYDPSKREN